VNTERQYQKEDGTLCTLDWLVRNKPEWAVNQIRHRDKLEIQLKDAREAIRALAISGDQVMEYSGFRNAGPRDAVMEWNKANERDIVVDVMDEFGKAVDKIIARSKAK